MRILRAKTKLTNIYMADPEGKAEIDPILWHHYLDAMVIIDKFETEVDKQYETPRSSSAPSTR